MPVLSYITPELESHVFYPVIKQMGHKVIYDLAIENIIKNNILVETGFSTPKNFHDGKHNATLQLNKLRLQAEINTNPNNLKWPNISFYHNLTYGISHTLKDRDYTIFFQDPTCGIKLYELWLPTYIQINCTLTLSDRNLAYQIPSMLYRKYAENNINHEHISYDYPLPKPIIALLFNLYKLKRFNKVDSFKKWLEICSDGNTQFSINRVNTKKELVMKKILIDSLFSLEYSEAKPNEVILNRGATQYEINFTMHIQFTRPDMGIIDYPIVLDNQLLPANLIPEELHRDEPLPNATGTINLPLWNEYLKGFNRVTNNKTKPVCVKFPYYDDWFVPSDSFLIQRSYRPWFSCIFTMDEENEYTELPMGGILDDDLGYEIHPVVKYILKEQGQESFYDDCIFNLAVFNNDIPVEKTYLKIDDDLNVSVKCIHKPIVRRIVLSEIQDLKYLNPKWLDLYKKYKDGLIANYISQTPIENTGGLNMNENKLINSINADLIVRKKD